MPAQVIAAKAVLVHVAEVLDSAFSGHPTLLLFFVMIMCPLCMNLLQVRQHLQSKLPRRAPGPMLGILSELVCVMLFAQALVQDAVLKWKKVQSTQPGENDDDAASSMQLEEEEGVRPKREQEDVRLLATTMHASSSVPAGRGGQHGSRREGLTSH